MHTRAGRGRIFAASALIYLFWGSSNLAMKFAMATIPPLVAAGGRLVLAGILMTGFALVRGDRCARRHLLTLAGLGALLFLGGHGGLFLGQNRLPSSVGALLLATMPLWVVLIEGFSPHGIRLGWRPAAGLSLGLLGVLMLLGPTSLLGLGRIDALGAAAVMFGAFSWAVGSICSSRARVPASGALSGGVIMLAGGALLLLAAVLSGETRGFHPGQVSLHSALAVGYLAVFCSLIGFSCFLWLLSVASPSRVATYAYVNPLVALVLGWSLAGDRITPRLLGAVVLLLGAVVLIVTAPAKGPGPALAEELESTVAP